MIHEVLIPQLGESVTEGVVSAWLKQEGEIVAAGEALCELETDKVTMQVPATHGGRLHLLVAAGTRVVIGQAIGTIDDAASASAAAAPPVLGAPAAEKPAAPSPPAPPLVPPAGLAQAKAKLAGATGPDLPLSPAVRRLVTEAQLDPAAIPGSGPGGRLTKGDLLEHLAAAAAKVAAPAPAPAPVPPPVSEPSPSDEGGVRMPGDRRETRKPMSLLRQRIAERMVLAQQQAAILTTFNEVDMSRVLELREQHRATFEKRHGIRLGMMSFFVKAVVDALQVVPALNARIDGTDIVQNHYYDIGVAVSTEQGLIVPVIRDCDLLGVAALERTLAELAARARARTIRLEELSGGCFTISNGGVYGSLLSTPILNPPQSGILGLHAIKERPVVVAGQLVARPMMYLAMSYDHRIIDGQQAVTFLKRVVECIENPERILLEV